MAASDIISTSNSPSSPDMSQDQCLSKRDRELGELFRSYLPEDLAQADFDFFVDVATLYQGSEVHEVLVEAADPYLRAVRRMLLKECDERKEKRE